MVRTTSNQKRPTHKNRMLKRVIVVSELCFKYTKAQKIIFLVLKYLKEKKISMYFSLILVGHHYYASI